MVRDVTLGQFLPGNSLMHRLDPRVKFLLVLSVIVFIFVAGNFVGLAASSPPWYLRRWQHPGFPLAGILKV